MRAPIIWIWLLCATAGCFSIGATAATPTANVIPARRYAGTVKLVALEVPRGEICSSHGTLKDFCVDNLYASIGGGLRTMLRDYVDGGAGPRYEWVFRLIEFSHAPAAGGGDHPAVQVMMRWQFELHHGDRKILQLARTTVGPEHLIDVLGAEKVVQAMLNTVLEAIGEELNEVAWVSVPAPATAGPAPDRRGASDKPASALP